MRLLKVDRRQFIDDFVYHEFVELDRNSQNVYTEPKHIENVLILFISSSKNEKMGVSDDTEAIIFCVANVTTPFSLFKKRSKVEIEGESYEIKKVFSYREPRSKNLWSVELEVG